MERKKFKRGTMTGGVIRTIIACVGILIAIIVLSSTIKSWDPEELGGKIFMCFISLVIIIASITFIVSGIKMIMDGRQSLIVLKKGHPENGKITDLTETEVTETVNGCISNYTIYNLEYEYTNDFGDLCETEEQISEKVYDQLKKRTLVPILVLGKRAVFDKKRFDSAAAETEKKTD